MENFILILERIDTRNARYLQARAFRSVLIVELLKSKTASYNVYLSYLTKLMKKYAYLIVSFFLLAVCSCSKVDVPSSLEDVSNYSESEAMENFVEILSQAVSQSEEVRSFLREKALEQVDNDYDVFYPFVRDERINDRYSFREYLISCSDEATLQRIEQRLPLLTIYVPDLTWIKEDAFSANSWDVSSNQVLVCNMDEEGTRHFYYEGKEELVLKRGEGIVSAPFLIVKNNERIQTTGATKSGDVQYAFVSPVFDGRRADTKGDIRYSGAKTSWAVGAPAEDNSDEISAADLNRIAPDAVRAYHEFKGVFNAAQRDYCYYGMTTKNLNGVLNFNVRDRLFRFQVDPSALQVINDTPNSATSHTDPLHFVNGNPYAEIDDNGNSSISRPLTYDACMEQLIQGGKFEFEITVYYGTSANASSARLFIDADVRELFVFNQINVTEYGSTWVKWYRVWQIVAPQNSIKAKWYYPKGSLYLPAWALYNGATSLYLVFKEIDSETTVSTTETVTNTFTIGIDPKIKFGEKYELGLNAQYQHEKTRTVATTEKFDSDEMGEVQVGYVDPYVRTASPNDNNPSSYTLMSYYTGRAKVSFLPDKLVY